MRNLMTSMEMCSQLLQLNFTNPIESAIKFLLLRFEPLWVDPKILKG